MSRNTEVKVLGEYLQQQMEHSAKDRQRTATKMSPSSYKDGTKKKGVRM